MTPKLSKLDCLSFQLQNFLSCTFLLTSRYLLHLAATTAISYTGCTETALDAQACVTEAIRRNRATSNHLKEGTF